MPVGLSKGDRLLIIRRIKVFLDRGKEVSWLESDQEVYYVHHDRTGPVVVLKECDMEDPDKWIYLKDANVRLAEGMEVQLRS